MPQKDQMTATDPAAEKKRARSSRKLRSSTVVLGSMGALAAVLSACSSEPDKRCVDRNSHDFEGYKVVSSQKCHSSSSGTATRTGGKKRLGRSGGNDPQWYYDSAADGRRADEGTFSKSAAVDRGGFGCSGSGTSSGG